MKTVIKKEVPAEKEDKPIVVIPTKKTRPIAKKNLSKNEYKCNHPDILSKGQNDELHKATYRFKAIGDKRGQVCEKGTSCYGWSIGGSYTVITRKADLKSSITITAVIRAPHTLSDHNIFNVGFLFPHGL